MGVRGCSLKPREPTLQIPSNDTEVERQHLGSAEALTVRGVELKEEERKKTQLAF